MGLIEDIHLNHFENKYLLSGLNKMHTQIIYEHKICGRHIRNFQWHYRTNRKSKITI